MAKVSVSNVLPLESSHRNEFLQNLLLDGDNPRFGNLEKSTSQADILDHIVEKFGVDDVLSSLSVNGYFDAEPLVCKKGHGSKYIVVEGNRRLAACLIITGDDRASRQHKRTEQYQGIWNGHGKKPIDPVPVIIFDGPNFDKTILSYLGVRHITASQPWDSFAKASWVAKVVAGSQLPLSDVALMIGDNHQTISHLLEGFYFIKQLEDTGNFRPEDSIRKGRGSVTEYPFSWVYTMLSYSSTRKFLEITEQIPKPNPIPQKNLSKAALVTKSMFGDRSKGRSSAISDSRQLGDLASALADPEKVSLLEQGKTIEDITRSTMPIGERLRQGLAQVREIQNDLIAGITEQGGVSREIAISLLDLATKNKRVAQDIEKKLSTAINPEDNE